MVSQLFYTARANRRGFVACLSQEDGEGRASFQDDEVATCVPVEWLAEQAALMHLRLDFWAE